MSSFAESYADYIGSARRSLIKRGTLTLAGEGADVADIPASVFGLTKLFDVSNGVKSDNSQIQPFAVVADGSAIVPIDVEQATDADRADIADLTGDFVLTVIGE